MKEQEKKETALVPRGEQALVATEGKKDSYWGKVATRYTLAMRLFVVVLILFVVLFMALFSRAFTYDSLFCFFKDLKMISAFVPSDYQTVTSTYVEGEQTVLSYRGGIAFVNPAGVEIYSPDGRRLLDVSRELKNPRAAASRKYLVAYDHGGKTFTVTNSYAELFHGETEQPIFGLAVSDSGHFALITGSDTALATVLLYDNNFNLIHRYTRASATVGVTISGNGKWITMLELFTENGQVGTKAEMFRVGEEESELTLLFEDEMPLSVAFTNDRYFALLTDKNVRFYHINGECEGAHPLSHAPVAFDVSEDGAVLAMKRDAAGNSHTLIAFDKKGRVQYQTDFSGDVLSLSHTKDAFYILTPEAVHEIQIESQEKTSVEIERGATAIFTVDRRALRVVYSAKAAYISFADR